jgi:hypothetical protein
VKVKILCSYTLEVEIPDDVNPWFYIEDNGCPGTGAVGLKLGQVVDEHDQNSTCWACACDGENKILEIHGGPHHGWTPEKETP